MKECITSPWFEIEKTETFHNSHTMNNENHVKLLQGLSYSDQPIDDKYIQSVHSHCNGHLRWNV